MVDKPQISVLNFQITIQTSLGNDRTTFTEFGEVSSPYLFELKGSSNEPIVFWNRFLKLIADRSPCSMKTVFKLFDRFQRFHEYHQMSLFGCSTPNLLVSKFIDLVS